MAHPFFAYIARMKYIGRWGLMRSTVPENVQEHSHMVAVLAHALAVIRRDQFGGTVDPGRVAAVALYHDAPEIFTGDLPTPVKYASPALRSAYQTVEDDAVRRLTAMLPATLRPAFAGLLTEDDPEVLALVKAADKLSAHLKCLEELKAGNREFHSAAQQTLAALKACRLPELDYFLSDFLPAFSLTLDELQTCQDSADAPLSPPQERHH
ncbi:MAG: 5'-deoxynucleotidase [Clostridiales bacterium]|mgnify:CR=1 FL=1|nr:5'-deoxynucleotidase [Clostridiales bacterium]